MEALPILGLAVALLACDGAAAVADDAARMDGSHDAAPRDAAPRDASAVDARAPDVAIAPRDAGPAPAPPTFVRFWGGRGTTPGLFIEPSSVELDSAGFVYVAGHENRFQKFTRDGELVAIYGSAGAGDGEFNHPHGLAVDRRRGDLVYVGDQENHRLQVFDTEGVFQRQWGDAGFRHIHDVGIDPASGEIFVGDYELHTLRRFSATGELLAEHGGPGTEPGRFNGIWGVSTDSEGYVYVADTHNRRVQKLGRDGTFVAEWRDFGGEPFVKPTGVFVDADDVVYVCDSIPNLIFGFHTDGTERERWDLAAITGFASEPEDVVIDAAGTHIYVAEVLDHRVLHLIRP